MCFYLGKPARWSAGLIPPQFQGAVPLPGSSLWGGGEGKRLPWGAQASCRRALGLRTSRPSAGWVKPVLHQQLHVQASTVSWLPLWQVPST